MNGSHGLWTAVAALAVLAAAPAATADGPAAELKFGPNPRLFDTHFSYYAADPARSLMREARGVRFRLPSPAGGLGEAGWYSYFALAGDFEVLVTYELIAVPPPSGGFGATVGISLDTEGPAGSVALAVGCLPEQGRRCVVTRGLPADSGLAYENTDYPASSDNGLLVLRRRKADLICLIADEPAAEPVELCRLPFTDGTVRKLRLFADPGGSPSGLDARLSDLVVRAEEITAGIPQREHGHTQWWIALGTIAALGTFSVVVLRRRRQRAA
jgi:hypothetical protein